MAMQFVSYEQASQWAQQQNIQTLNQWKNLPKGFRPSNIPASPEFVYKNQWDGWSSFLKNGRRKKSVPTATYEECLQWARDNCIQTAKQWYGLKDRLPSHMPTAPDKFFAQEWVGWPEFLGTNQLSGVSIIERVIRLVLDSVLHPEASEHRKQSAVGLSGKKYMVDMLYRTEKLVVEYDGEFYHLGKEKSDEMKTQDLELAGWKVVRIREGKLEILNPVWDIHVKKYRQEEDKVKCVLKHILNLYKSGHIDLTDQKRERLIDLVDNLILHPFYEKLGNYNEFVSYKECQKWALDLQISGEAHWRSMKHLMEKDHIPYHPERTYKNRGWTNWPDFLKNGQRSKKQIWATYEEASAWAQKNQVKTAKDWYFLKDKRPHNMPTAPDVIYKNKWENWPIFLGNGKTAQKSFSSYEQASQWAKENGIQTGKQWRLHQSKPRSLPKDPEKSYSDQWRGWSEFLGVENNWSKRKSMFSYHEASLWAKKQNIKSSTQWRCMDLPPGLPRFPNAVYKKQWLGWKEFLGVVSSCNPKKQKVSHRAPPKLNIRQEKPKQVEFLSYQEASQWAQDYGIINSILWRELGGNRPADIPAAPHLYYKKEWTNWGAFLKTNRVANQYKVFVSFEEASLWAQNNNITSSNQWKQCKRRPINIPSIPMSAYKDQWKGWPNFLNLPRTIPASKKIWASYWQAQEWARSQGIKTAQQWYDHPIRPSHIPYHPDRCYKSNGWSGWREFLKVEKN